VEVTMRRSTGVGIVLLVAALVIPSNRVEAQQTGGGRPPKAQLGSNYPNPFNPTTTIPFTLPAELFEGGKSVVVTILIKDIIMRPVAYPAALNHESGNVLVSNLRYTTPGEKKAYWDGTDRSGRKVASGIYYVELIVQGERVAHIKIVVAN
jgi:hypothetical protein